MRRTAALTAAALALALTACAPPEEAPLGAAPSGSAAPAAASVAWPPGDKQVSLAQRRQAAKERRKETTEAQRTRRPIRSSMHECKSS